MATGVDVDQGAGVSAGSRFRVLTLGSFDVLDVEGRRVMSVVAQRKRSALLAYLAIEGLVGPVERDKVCALFWPELDQERSRANLRNALHFLRRSMGQGAIQVIGDEQLVLNRDMVSCDAAEVLSGSTPWDGASFLEGVHVRGAGVDFEHWIQDVRRRLNNVEVRGSAGVPEPAGALGPGPSRAARPLWAMAAPVLVFVALTVAVRLGGAAGESESSAFRLQPIERSGRVLLLPLKSPRGDQELADIAKVGSSWLARRVTLADLADIVSFQTVSDSFPDPAVIDLSRAADLAFAGLVVSGEVHRSGDSVLVTTRIVRAPELVTQSTLDPEGARVEDPVPAFDRAADRVLGALGLHYARGWTGGLSRPPPSLAVLRLETEALAAFYRPEPDYDRFHELADSILASDSSYFPYQIIQHRASAFWNQRNIYPRFLYRSDSTLSYLAARSAELSPSEVRNLRWDRAVVSGDLEAEWAAASDQNKGPRGTYRLAMSARRTNRLELSVDAISQRDVVPQAKDWRGWDQHLLRALAMLGRFEDLLAASLEAQSLHPDYGEPLLFEARAHAALGNFEALNGVVERARLQSESASQNPAIHLIGAAEVAFAQGGVGEAAPVARRALALADELEEQGIDVRGTKAAAFGLVGDWDRARDLYGELVAEDSPPSVRIHRLGAHGAALAQLGRPTEALSRVAELERWAESHSGFYLAGLARFEQARIRASLGDATSAVELLREALGSGQTYDVWARWDPHLVALHSDPRYQALVAPKPD